MNVSEVNSFNHTLELSDSWIKELKTMTGWNAQRAYHAFRVVMHVLRDFLPVGEAVNLGSEMPMLLRGLYYEGWRPAGKPVRGRGKQDFLSQIKKQYKNDDHTDLEQAISSVYHLLCRHISQGEMEEVKNVMPSDVKQLLH